MYVWPDIISSSWQPFSSSPRGFSKDLKDFFPFVYTKQRRIWRTVARRRWSWIRKLSNSFVNHVEGWRSTAKPSSTPKKDGYRPPHLSPTFVRFLRNTVRIVDVLNTVVSGDREVCDLSRCRFLQNVIRQFSHDGNLVHYICFHHDYFQAVPSIF